jgi:hypothetical protein
VRPDPEAAWRQMAADLGALAEDYIRAVFAWIDRELAVSGSRGAVDLILALRALDGQDAAECAGDWLPLAVINLLIAADVNMPCPCAAALSGAVASRPAVPAAPA